MTKDQLAGAWEKIANDIEALLPHLNHVEKFAPSIVIDSYRAKAKKLRLG
jgi:hypothetical protein